MDEPSEQLQSDLRRSVQDALGTRRPIIHRLNGDNSWFLQIPRPDSAVRHGSRLYYNILIDPWFNGPQTDLSWWFSLQYHVVPSAVQSIADLEDLAREIELLASELRPQDSRRSDGCSQDEEEAPGTLIDAVAISHEFTDHCHEETLLQVNRDVPIFTTKEAAALIGSWNHFRTIITIPVFGKEHDTHWRSTSIPPLPDWVGISRLLQTHDVIALHSALMITFNNQHHNRVAKLAKPEPFASGKRKRHEATAPSEDEDYGEAVIHTPHGVSADDLAAIVPTAHPPIRTLALLHGLHDVKVGESRFGTALQINLGAANGLRAQRVTQAKYWFGTHDEVKKGSGIIAWMLKTKLTTLRGALEVEMRKGTLSKEEAAHVLDVFEELKSGESRVLV